MTDAISMVTKNKSDSLISMLAGFLMGDTDSTPKDPLWTFKLQLELGNYRQASRIAVIIAAQEQEMGN